MLLYSLLYLTVPIPLHRSSVSASGKASPGRERGLRGGGRHRTLDRFRQRIGHGHRRGAWPNVITARVSRSSVTALHASDGDLMEASLPKPSLAGNLAPGRLIVPTTATPSPFPPPQS
jgi:hypothetical protein